MKAYKLTKNHTHGDQECKPGDIIELTDDQAKAFSDRVVLFNGDEDDGDDGDDGLGEDIKNPEGELDPGKGQGPPAL